jgi:uncharacterized membrane protein
MEIIVLSIRVIHVLLGVFWAGAVFFLLLYLEPTVREVGPDAGKVMSGLQRRGMTRTLLGVGLVTIVTGVYLLWQLSGGFSGSFMGSRSGILLSTGMLAALLALGVGAHVSKPTAERLTSLGEQLAAAGAPPSDEDQAEMARLRNKLRGALRVVATLLLVALVTMALGPHV